MVGEGDTGGNDSEDGGGVYFAVCVSEVEVSLGSFLSCEFESLFVHGDGDVFLFFGVDVFDGV